MAELSGEIAIGVLGPLAVSVGGRPVELTTPRLRTLLAVLAMSAGRPVSIERQAAALWDEDPPDNARRNVQTYLARLRGALGVGAIAAGPDGYRLRAEPDRVDALKFVTLLDAAARTSDASAERARLREALALWRGAPFEGMRSSWLERSEAPRLRERYLAAVERRIDIDLALGQPGELTAELSQLIARHPLRESLWERLLVVLDHTGRQAEALERYESIRRQLADELGTDPGPRLRRIHADLLRREPPEQPPGGTMPAISGSQVVPKQLPAGVDGFTGREAALTVLNHLIRDDDQGRATGTVAIAAITGAAGVGKTALAVHWAHQVADRFPDGQLYLNLRGFGPSGAAALDPADAARRCLDALGVPPHRVPADLDAQLGLYRSLLAGRRMLIVLDNARDADQVGPLLPGSPTCLALVTSRDQLARLVATTAASSVLLDLLTVDEARGLLAHRLGADRVAAEPQATDEIITRCARLPLALAIAAARATTNPAFPLRALASELRDAQSGLDTLTVGDPGTEVRTVFSWSYRVASPAAARLFRLLGLHPGPDLRLPAAASLAGLPAARTRPLLAELTRAHLLTEHAPGRYTFHDLLRAYATELSQAHDSHQQRQPAVRRMLDHYLHTGHTAALV
ncbi:MAG: BTAD domain-containing putative transcriptional regulator, partial [Natronosporangium sp.]